MSMTTICVERQVMHLVVSGLLNKRITSASQRGLLRE
jgi:FixJ family two-component response regulator